MQRVLEILTGFLFSIFLISGGIVAYHLARMASGTTYTQEDIEVVYATVVFSLSVLALIWTSEHHKKRARPPA